MEVDFGLVQRQVREELHLEKQHIGQRGVSTKALEFERGNAENRVRIVLSEIERLRKGWASRQEHKVAMRTPFQPLSSILSNPLYRAELTILLTVISLKCRSPPVDFEALIHTLSLVREPATFITALVANSPHNFFPIVDFVVRHDPMGSSKAILLQERDLKVCAILMCAAQLIKQAESKLRRILVSLLEHEDSPQVLLMAIYFRTDQLLLIDEFASNVLSMDIVVPRSGLIELRRVFLSLFSDHQLATSALALGHKSSIPSSPDPHALHQQVPSLIDPQKLNSIATFCVYQLLKEGAFQRSNVDVRHWVFEQIRSIVLPLDENLVPLLRAYTSATSQSDAISRIPEQSIREIFSISTNGYTVGGGVAATSSIMTPAKAILALYMLMNNEVYLQNLATDNYDKNAEYPGRFLESIHIRKVMLYVMQHEDGMAFKEIQPMFMKLATAQFPEMFDITTLLLEEEAEAAAPQGYGFKKGGTLNKPSHWPSVVRPVASLGTAPMTPYNALQNLCNILSQSIERPEAAVAAYHSFQRLSAFEMEQMAEALIYSSLPRLLDPRASPKVLEAFKKTWDKLNGLMSHDLWAMTVNAVRATSVREVSDVINRAGKESEHKTTVLQPSMTSSFDVPRTATSVMVDGPFWTYEWLLEDPLLLFRVNSRVFRQPVILRIFIQILDAIMVGSRHWLRKLFHASMAISLHSAPSTAGGVGAGMGSRRPGGGGVIHSSSRAQLPVRTFLEPQLNTLLQLQESSLVQLVLEAIRYTPKEIEENRRKRQQQQPQQQQYQHQQIDITDDETHEADQEEQDEVMKEVREIVFNFVHQLFINPKFQYLPKLLHFQGYKKDLIPTVVKGLPSIHVCLGFIQELVGQDNEETQRFALRLAAQLCDHLPLPKTYQMVTEFILPKLEELLFRTQLTAPEVIKSVAVLCHAFPSLKNTLVQMLEAARSSSMSGPMQQMSGSRLVSLTIESMERMAKDHAITDKSVL
ncbi:Integrator complex subunit 2 [Actinomortierella wolfii]|nr:Integrator complex subunit 2 [Actinomortierella wolfii]